MKKVTGSIFCTSTWKFISSFGICFCSPCSAVALRGFCRHGQGTKSSPRRSAGPMWPWGWAGEDQRVFPAGMGLENLCVWGMHGLPPALSQMKPLHLCAGFAADTLLYCTASLRSKPEQKKFSLAHSLFFTFMTLCEFQSASGLGRGKTKRSSQPSSKTDSFLSPKYVKNINK